MEAIPLVMLFNLRLVETEDEALPLETTPTRPRRNAPVCPDRFNRNGGVGIEPLNRDWISPRPFLSVVALPVIVVAVLIVTRTPAARHSTRKGALDLNGRQFTIYKILGS